MRFSESLEGAGGSIALPEVDGGAGGIVGAAEEVEAGEVGGEFALALAGSEGGERKGENGTAGGGSGGHGMVLLSEQDAEGGTAKVISAPEGAINFNMGTLVGSYASIARMLDEAATVPGTKGIMLTFDDFLIGMEQFGERIQPLMKSRREKLAAVA